ncbi:MAG TPA: NADH:flavin oxidoreductase/NADH oxidase [Candidatus Saccharimonadales bacterium]|jgi:2,4-dienoyl-CoA reductase-like NADH-dependent reductase (Old Yellow Enzyme family)|nr:NADH:flavin oxidoreductase/NADH oxidase [Candidatus Saccharimonadales bacterium]
MAHLFEPFQLREISFRNRIMVSPMCQYSCKDGLANDWHLVHLGGRAVGGAALVMVEATGVTPDGRISAADHGLWNDDQVEPLRRIFNFLEQQGTVTGIQLGHAGRKASTAEPWKGGHPVAPADGGWTPIYAPSALPFAPTSQVPKALTAAEIGSILQAFAAAAKRALECRAKVIELHAAHGYLLHSFLSPLSNRRTDEYGGSFDNRTRMVRETVTAVRRVWPERLPLFVRISATDWAEGGWTLEETVALARILKPLGVDAIDCSSGGAVPGVRIPVGPGFQTGFAQQVREQAQIATVAVGMITSPEQADQIIRSGNADAVMLARELLRDPYWPLRAARVLGHDVHWPAQYERAKLK